MINEFDGRLRVLGVVVILIIFALILRAGYLQVYNGEYYSRLADGNRIRVIPYTAPRGLFYDRNGESLVSNRPGFTVSLLPLNSPVSDDVVNRLAKLLNVPAKDIKERIGDTVGVDPIRIKYDVSLEIISIIEEQKDMFPGVIIEVQPIRKYINNQLAAHTIGYVAEISADELDARKGQDYRIGDIIGKYGLERFYDKELRGSRGGQQVEVDVSGTPVQILGSKDAVPGNDIYLTLDKRIQEAAERAVDRVLARLDTKGAAAVVMNPQTGEVMAMVSRPAFDPNKFINGISQKDWQEIIENPFYTMDNKAISGEYPPGSTFKIVTGIAALAEGKVTPEEKILDTGVYWIDEKTNAAGEALGWINFAEAMAHSDNIYFYEMGYRLGIDNLEKYSRMFGLGRKTGINLPFESEGLVASKKYKEEVSDEEWYVSETLDAAIGQGFNLVTPLQAAMVMGQMAAGGKCYRPYLVDKIVAADGTLVKKFGPILDHELDVPQDIIRLVQNSLNDVTNYGTASSFFGHGFPVNIAGKTGTAENPHGRDHGWFVAYGPFENPNVVVAVVVEQGGFGASSAVPIGREILSAIFTSPPPPARPEAKPNGKTVTDEKADRKAGPADGNAAVTSGAGNSEQGRQDTNEVPGTQPAVNVPQTEAGGKRNGGDEPQHLPKPHSAPQPRQKPGPAPKTSAAEKPSGPAGKPG